MDTINEPQRLRRRIAKQLGRPISDAAWALAIEQEYVAEALDPAYSSSAEAQLIDYLARVLSVVDAGPHKRRRATRSNLGYVPRGSVTSARIEVVSRLAAELAAGDEEILRFRQRVLGRSAPMSAEEAEAYLDLPEARGSAVGLPQPSSFPILKYQNRHISHDLHVWPDSPLDRLRKLAESLAQSYPWEPEQAAAFVLEGLIPHATPFMLHLPQQWHDGRPRRARLVMKVDLWMPAAEVLRAYREVQRKVLPGHNRPISLGSIELVNFVMGVRTDATDGPVSWVSLFERWNTEHPGRGYANYRSFRSAATRASRSLLYPAYRTYFGE